MSDEVPKSEWERFRDQGGWVAFIITVVVGDLTVMGALTALAEGGPGALDIQGAALFWKVFVVTAPLLIAAIIFVALAETGALRSGFHVIGAGALALASGAGLGAALGNETGITVAQAVATNSQTAGSSPPAIAARLMEYLIAYHVLYGWQYFVASLILGAFFGHWAARLLSRSAET
jgi:hypothetical protein